MFERRSDGSFTLHLSEDDRRFLASLADELGRVLSDEPDDPALRRLFPPAYPDDVTREAGYQMLMGDELRSSREHALTLLRETAERTELNEEEVTGWVQAVNSLRLVLGTRLDVTEDDDAEPPGDDDPQARAKLVYHYLGVVLERAVDGLA
jgi:hypothetical protein